MTDLGVHVTVTVLTIRPISAAVVLSYLKSQFL